MNKGRQRLRGHNPTAFYMRTIAQIVRGLPILYAARASPPRFSPSLKGLLGEERRAGSCGDQTSPALTYPPPACLRRSRRLFRNASIWPARLRLRVGATGWHFNIRRARLCTLFDVARDLTAKGAARILRTALPGQRPRAVKALLRCLKRRGMTTAPMSVGVTRA